MYKTYSHYIAELRYENGYYWGVTYEKNASSHYTKELQNASSIFHLKMYYTRKLNFSLHYFQVNSQHILNWTSEWKFYFHDMVQYFSC